MELTALLIHRVCLGTGHEALLAHEQRIPVCVNKLLNKRKALVPSGMSALEVCMVFLIYWIPDTLSQGYNNLQTLVKCLDHRGIASDTVCSQARLY